MSTNFRYVLLQVCIFCHCIGLKLNSRLSMREVMVSCGHGPSIGDLQTDVPSLGQCRRCKVWHLLCSRQCQIVTVHVCSVAVLALCTLGISDCRIRIRPKSCRQQEQQQQGDMTLTVQRALKRRKNVSAPLEIL